MITALITVYHPTLIHAVNIENISQQVDKVYICDNSPQNNEILFKDIKNKRYHYNNGENLGLSKAFNVILKSNCFFPEDYIIFFDQDSCITENYIQTLLQEHKKLTQAGYNVGALGPVYYNTNSQTVEIPKNRKYFTENTFTVKSIITSSMLCTYSSLQKINFWNEQIFLDMSDLDICWRFLSKQFLVCMTDAVLLQHSMGLAEKKIGRIHLTEEKPIREYYQIRDSLHLFFKPYIPFSGRKLLCLILFILPLLHILFLNNSSQRIRFIKKGVIDFIKNKQGSLQDN